MGKSRCGEETVMPATEVHQAGAGNLARSPSEVPLRAPSSNDLSESQRTVEQREADTLDATTKNPIRPNRFSRRLSETPVASAAFTPRSPRRGRPVGTWRIQALAHMPSSRANVNSLTSTWMRQRATSTQTSWNTSTRSSDWSALRLCRIQSWRSQSIAMC